MDKTITLWYVPLNLARDICDMMKGEAINQIEQGNFSGASDILVRITEIERDIVKAEGKESV